MKALNQNLWRGGDSILHSHRHENLKSFNLLPHYTAPRQKEIDFITNAVRTWHPINFLPLKILKLYFVISSLHNRLTDGGEVVALKRRPRSTPQKHLLVLISISSWGTIFLGSKVRPGRYGWQHCRHLWTDCLENLWSLIPHNPIGPHGQLRG
jgi:hypothetical protein